MLEEREVQLVERLLAPLAQFGARPRGPLKPGNRVTRRAAVVIDHLIAEEEKPPAVAVELIDLRLGRLAVRYGLDQFLCFFVCLVIFD